jgi:hypothetical protein
MPEYFHERLEDEGLDKKGRRPEELREIERRGGKDHVDSVPFISMQKISSHSVV